ncbi:hypothetical protein [Enterococcus malodoratus]|uniref:hypothetical protein n=1 Tax=Enterococcus malodoratus TaxID=71451 RepID=UPI002072B3FB|nr:hypothetical protein [Enterococcus malodoratus]
MQTMRRIDVQINGKLVGSCDSINKVSSPLFKDILDPWIEIEGFVPVEPSLNKNQHIVLKWLKEEKTNSNLTAFDCIYSFIYGNPKDIVTQIWSELNEKEEGQVLEVFSRWVQEQEE